MHCVVFARQQPPSGHRRENAIGFLTLSLPFASTSGPRRAQRQGSIESLPQGRIRSAAIFWRKIVRPL